MQNHHLDSTRWEAYRRRQNDIIIATYAKVGTTWTQRIVGMLVFQSTELPATLGDASPWLDRRFAATDNDPALLEAQTHRRFIKSHLPLFALPWDEEVKYIAVGRDVRDVAMSLFNHDGGYTDLTYSLLNDDARPGEPIPRCPEDVRVFWRDWITRGWFPWEHDGWPFWSYADQIASFWEERHRPNVLLVHYNDLTGDLDGEMRRISAFLDIPVDEAIWPDLVEAATFSSMKADAATLLPQAAFIWEGGTDQFIYKGTNGRWREVLTDEDLALYEDMAGRLLEPDLREWLEHGSPAG